MKNFALRFAALFAFTLTAHAELHVVRGTHFDNDYEFAMSDEYEDVHGSWGESRYDLVWDRYDGVLKGSTAGEKQLLRIDYVFRTIELTSYCGWGDLNFSATAPWTVNGDLCGERVERDFATRADAEAWLSRELTLRMVTEFPEPVRDVVQRFLAGLLLYRDPIHESVRR